MKADCKCCKPTKFTHSVATLTCGMFHLFTLCVQLLYLIFQYYTSFANDTLTVIFFTANNEKKAIEYVVIESCSCEACQYNPYDIAQEKASTTMIAPIEI